MGMISRNRLAFADHLASKIRVSSSNLCLSAHFVDLVLRFPFIRYVLNLERERFINLYQHPLDLLCADRRR